MASVSTSSGQSTSTGQGTSESHGRTYIPDYPQAPLLQAIAQYAFDQAPQVYDWGMAQFNKNQGNIDGLMRDALSYASPQRISVDMGMAESGVQQAAEKGRLSAVRDLEGYGIDPSSGRYAALDKANRVMAAASAAGAGNQQRMADEAAGNAMRNQAIASSLQNTQVGYEAAKAMNALLATGSQLKYPPLGNVSDTVSQHTQESQSTQRSTSTSDQGGGGGAGGPGAKSGGSQPTHGGGDQGGGGGGGQPAGGARAPAAPRGGGGGGGGGAEKAPRPEKPSPTPQPGPKEPKPPSRPEPEPPPLELPPGVDPENPSGPYDPTKDPASPDYVPPGQAASPLDQPPGIEYGEPPPAPYELPPDYEGAPYTAPAETGETLVEGNPLGEGNPLTGDYAGQYDPSQYDYQAPGGTAVADQGAVPGEDTTGTGEGQGPTYQLPGDYAGQFDPTQYDQTGVPTDYAGQYDPNQYDYQAPDNVPVAGGFDPETAAPFQVAGGDWQVPTGDTGAEAWPMSQYDPNQYDQTVFGQGGDQTGSDWGYQWGGGQDVSGTGAEAAGGYDFSGQDFTQYDPYSDQSDQGYADPNQYDNWGATGDQYGDQSQADFGGASDYYDPNQYDTGGDNWDTSGWDQSGDQSYDTSGDQSNWDTGGDNWDTSQWDNQSNWDTSNWGDQSNWDTGGNNYDYGDYGGGDTSGGTSGDTSGNTTDYGGDYTDYSSVDEEYYARGGPVKRRQPMPMQARGPMRRPRLPMRPRPPIRPPVGRTGYNPNPRLSFGPRSGGPMSLPPQRPQPPVQRMAAGGPMRRPQPAPDITQMAAGGPPAMPRGGYLQASGMPQSQAGAIPMPGGGMPAPQRMQRGGSAQRPRGPNPQQATSGGFVSRELSPSNGSQTDDVNAQLNAGEFVVPKDVAVWHGKKFFYDLIAKARKARTVGRSNSGGTGYGAN